MAQQDEFYVAGHKYEGKRRIVVEELLNNLAAEDTLAFAKHAQAQERFEDMRKSMLHYVAVVGRQLTREERTMLALSYQNTTRLIRNALEAQKDGGFTPETDAYMNYLCTQLHVNIDELCHVGKNILLPKAKADGEPEMLTYYFKMAGDYYRYLCDWDLGKDMGEGKTENVEKAKGFYTNAMKSADTLPISEPARLGTVLNFGVFTKEHLEGKTVALEMMKPIYEECYKLLETCDDETFKKSSVILSLMQDNCTLWENEE